MLPNFEASQACWFVATSQNTQHSQFVTEYGWSSSIDLGDDLSPADIKSPFDRPISRKAEKLAKKRKNHADALATSTSIPWESREDGCIKFILHIRNPWVKNLSWRSQQSVSCFKKTRGWEGCSWKLWFCPDDICFTSSDFEKGFISVLKRQSQKQRNIENFNNKFIQLESGQNNMYNNKSTLQIIWTRMQLYNLI